MILIVDDNLAIGEALALLLELNGYSVATVTSPAEALRFVAAQPVDLLIQDMNFELDTTSGEEGYALFYQLRALQADLPIILMTAWANLSMAVELVKSGAADYISKPWDDAKLLITVNNLLQLAQTQIENKRLQDKEQQYQQLKGAIEQHNLCGTVFESPQMQRLIDMAVQVAPTDVPVLITGPNGSGKEKVAEIVQANSRRQGQPFVKVNVGALSADLLEAELFGAEKGAYTGADKRRLGRFEAANGGTLFLDEMGNMSAAGQQKLLRVLQSGEFERVGSSDTQKVDVRVITATNENLQQAIDEGRFREDLYYRLNVIELKVLPLVERVADILPLAISFLASAAPTKSLSAGAGKGLEQYHWPGNVRELSNRIQRAALLSPNNCLQIDDFDLPHNNLAVVAATELSPEQIQSVLDKHGGVVARAARELSISRQALYRRLAKQD